MRQASNRPAQETRPSMGGSSLSSFVLSSCVLSQRQRAGAPHPKYYEGATLTGCSSRASPSQRTAAIKPIIIRATYAVFSQTMKGTGEAPHRVRRRSRHSTSGAPPLFWGLDNVPKRRWPGIPRNPRPQVLGAPHPLPPTTLLQSSQVNHSTNSKNSISPLLSVSSSLKACSSSSSVSSSPSFSRSSFSSFTSM